MCLHCLSGLVSSSRAETTDTMSSHPVNTGNTLFHSHGETFLLVQWLTVFSLSQSLLPITPSLVHAACVSQRSCHGDTGDTVCRYPDVCAEKGPVAAADVECQLRPRPSVACQARTGPLSTTILYYPPLYTGTSCPHHQSNQLKTVQQRIIFISICSIFWGIILSTETYFCDPENLTLTR